MFDAKLQVLDANILEGEDHIEIAFTLGILIPVDAEGHAMPVPAGIVRVPLGKAGAQDLSARLADASANLPEQKRPSDLVISNDVRAAEQAAARVADQQSVIRGS